MERKQRQADIPAHNQDDALAAQRRASALFDEREGAEIALNDLERNGIPRNKIAIIVPEAAPPPETRLHEERGSIDPGMIPPTLPGGFFGWTAGMAPWVMTGAGPVVVFGSLSLTRPSDRPHDLDELAAVLGLSEEATERLREGFKRNAILVTAEAPEKNPIANHILERNGGHSLPAKQKTG